MRGIQGTRGMFTRIPGNPLEDSGECSHFSIPGNVQEDSGECSRRFQGMFEKIPGDVREDSGECSSRFRGMLMKIPGNAIEDSGECYTPQSFQNMWIEVTCQPMYSRIFRIQPK